MRGGVGDYRIGTVEPFLVAFTAELQEFNQTEMELCNGGFLSAIGEGVGVLPNGHTGAKANSIAKAASSLRSSFSDPGQLV